MTIDEANKTFELLTETVDPWPSKELKEAAKLGIEALKWVKRYRPDNKIDRWDLLLGETRE